MRVNDETVFELFGDYVLADLFGTTQQMMEAKSRVEAIGSFDKLEARYDKISRRIQWLRTARDTTITIIELDNSETIMNRLEYEREKRNLTEKDERLISSFLS